jgi:hypothetical protein
MVSNNLIHRCFEISTLYATFTVILFIVKSDFIIPLTYRHPTYKWGELQKLFRENPIVVPQKDLDKLLSTWCPSNFYAGLDSKSGPKTGMVITANSSIITPVSPQCSCIREFNITFANNSATFLKYLKGNGSGGGPKDLSQLGDLQARGVLDACLMKRATWQRHTCAHFCQIHLAVPVIVSCLCMSLFLARKAEYGVRALDMLSFYVPIALAVLFIVVNMASNPLASIPSVVTVISALFEVYSSCSYSSYVEDFREYWSFHRFFVASLAVQAAVTHQARDLYAVYSYAILGFSIGMLAYTEYILRFKQGCNKRMRVVAIYSWVGICVISACLCLLVHQHWYSYSPTWSSLISVICLFVSCLQCIVMVPGVRVSETIQLATGFLLLTIIFLAATVDMLMVTL